MTDLRTLRRRDFTGQRFFKLVAIRPTDAIAKGRMAWQKK